jgi:hypothetical protein
MNKDEFKAKALQVLVLADQLEVLQGGKLNTYTEQLNLFEVARCPKLGTCYDFVARIWDPENEHPSYSNTFMVAYGDSEEDAINAMVECLQVQAEAQEAHNSSFSNDDSTIGSFFDGKS